MGLIRRATFSPWPDSVPATLRLSAALFLPHAEDTADDPSLETRRRIREGPEGSWNEGQSYYAKWLFGGQPRPRRWAACTVILGLESWRSGDPQCQCQRGPFLGPKRAALPRQTAALGCCHAEAA